MVRGRTWFRVQDGMLTISLVAGYSIAEASWLPSSDLPEPRQSLMDQFYAAAADEGQSVTDDTNMVLLEVAREGGWPKQGTVKFEPGG